MLNERTAASAVVSRPEEPVSPSPSQVVRQLADFLDGLPGLPELYITISHTKVGLQLPSYEPAVPQDRFPAVSRLAQAMGAGSHLRPWGLGGWTFEASGRVGELYVHVYAPFDDVTAVAADADEDDQERA